MEQNLTKDCGTGLYRDELEWFLTDISLTDCFAQSPICCFFKTFLFSTFCFHVTLMWFCIATKTLCFVKHAVELIFGSSVHTVVLVRTLLLKRKRKKGVTGLHYL